MQECRFYLAGNYFYFFYVTANITTLILFIYMSVMFSRPLDGFWTEFLLSYRKKTLNEAIQAKLPPTEQERAKRYNEAAVRDANRQILIMQALFFATEESFVFDPTESDDQSLLNTHERAILDDSFDRPTSDQLFEQVRQEAANGLYDSKHSINPEK